MRKIKFALFLLVVLGIALPKSMCPKEFFSLFKKDHSCCQDFAKSDEKSIKNLDCDCGYVCCNGIYTFEVPFSYFTNISWNFEDFGGEIFKKVFGVDISKPPIV